MDGTLYIVACKFAGRELSGLLCLGAPKELFYRDQLSDM